MLESRTGERVWMAAGTVAWWLGVSGVGMRQGENSGKCSSCTNRLRWTGKGGRGRREKEGMSPLGTWSRIPPATGCPSAQKAGIHCPKGVQGIPNPDSSWGPPNPARGHCTSHTSAPAPPQHSFPCQISRASIGGERETSAPLGSARESGSSPQPEGKYCTPVRAVPRR